MQCPKTVVQKIAPSWWILDAGLRRRFWIWYNHSFLLPQTINAFTLKDLEHFQQRKSCLRNGNIPHLHGPTLQHIDKAVRVCGGFKSLHYQSPTAVYLRALGAALTSTFLPLKIRREIWRCGNPQCHSPPPNVKLLLLRSAEHGWDLFMVAQGSKR